MFDFLWEIPKIPGNSREVFSGTKKAVELLVSLANFVTAFKRHLKILAGMSKSST